MSHDGCADWSAALAEPLGGTAASAEAWLLVEDPGAWGERGLLDSSIDAQVATELDRLATDAHVRVQLIRRPDRLAGQQRQVFVAVSRPGATWLAQLTGDTSDPRLAQLDLAALTHPDTPPPTPDWEPVEGPLFLVCTHAKRDPCCAVYGRAAAAVLAVTQRERSWETSHTGGHRFAPNLICLPHGLAFGRLDPESVDRAAAAYEAGDVLPAGYRGRSSYDPAVQAADVAVRERLGRLPVDAVELEHVEVHGDTRTVHLRTPTGSARVQVVHRPTGTPRLIGCHKDQRTDPGEHVVTELQLDLHG